MVPAHVTIVFFIASIFMFAIALLINIHVLDCAQEALDKKTFLFATTLLILFSAMTSTVSGIFIYAELTFNSPPSPAAVITTGSIASFNLGMLYSSLKSSIYKKHEKKEVAPPTAGN